MKTSALVFLLAAVMAVGVQSAKAEDSGAPFITSTLKDEDFGKLDDSMEQTSMDGNINEAELLANEEVARQTHRESENLKAEIKDLEKQVRGLKSGAEYSRKKAALAHKKLDLYKAQSVDAKRRLSQAEKEQKREEAKRLKLLESAKSFEQKAQAAREATRERQDSIRELTRENNSLTRQVKKYQAQIEREQKRMKALREKQARLSKENRRLKSESARAERRLSRN